MAVAFTSAAATTDAQVSTSTPSRLMGFSVHETAAAVATVTIRDGTSTAGAPVAYISLAAAGGQTQWFGPQGIVCSGGIFLDRVTGTTECTVWYE